MAVTAYPHAGLSTDELAALLAVCRSFSNLPAPFPAGPSRDELEELLATLRTKSLLWVASFLEGRGLGLLCELLEQTGVTATQDGAMLQSVLESIRVLIETEEGMLALIPSVPSIVAIAKRAESSAAAGVADSSAVDMNEVR